MKIQYRDLEDVFMFVNSGQPYDHSAYICKESGKTYYESDYGDSDELPEDIDDPKYVAIPDKAELNLGKNLVLDFASEYLGNNAEEVEHIFRSKGAYARFKKLLHRLGKLELWYGYENNAQQKAILDWCEINNITVVNIPEYKPLVINLHGSLDNDVRRQYLKHTEIIDWQHPEIKACSKKLYKGCSSRSEYIKKAFEFVRDKIKHSWDFQENIVTCTASEVFAHKTGYCYAKSHLLAALLRAQGIPAGFCYQRLSLNENGAPYCLHGLNAVFLPEFGWYRIDARGNKQGVDAQFMPPKECVAFAPAENQEKDLPEIWCDPLPVVVEALKKYADIKLLHENLPDIQIIT